VAALRHEGVYDAVKDKLVLGENISQTASFVASGNADVGIVALSLASAPSMKDKGKFQEIPSSAYPPLDQAAVILKSSPQKELAHRLLAYLKTPAVQELLRNYGFSLPETGAQ
jgi:molybdate transport system substrate-binding protein